MAKSNDGIKLVWDGQTTVGDTPGRHRVVVTMNNIHVERYAEDALGDVAWKRLDPTASPFWVDATINDTWIEAVRRALGNLPDMRPAL